MAAPTTTDFTNFLAVIGVTASGSAVLATILADATQEFEERTGRQKYEGDSATTAVRYTLPWPQGKSVLLTIADCWTITEVRVDYSGAGTGTALTEWDDYVLRPTGYAQKSRPVEAIQFQNLPSTKAGSILITGKLGYASSMPSAVFEAILCRASAMLIERQAGESGTITEEKNADRSVKYSSAEESTRNRLIATFNSAVSRYTKVAY
jgi:hypothetical protein